MRRIYRSLIPSALILVIASAAYAVDNSTLPVFGGSTEVFANEDIAGVKYPKNEFVWGPAGTVNKVDIATGKPLPVQLRSATGLIPIGEPTDAKSTATDGTSASLVSILKQISASVQSSTSGTQWPTSTARLLSAAASVNATNVKGSAGRLFAIQGQNASASFRYLKLYNKATAPTVGTDTPIKTIALAPGPFSFQWPAGYAFATGIGYGITTAAADADTGAVTAADIVTLNIDYQ